MEILLFKGSCTNSPTLGLSTKSAVWKVLRPYTKESHLLILKCLPEGQSLLGFCPGKEVLVGAIFAFFPCLVVSTPTAPSALPELGGWVSYTHSPAKASRKVYPPQNTPLECLALLARDDSISGHYESTTIREIVISMLPPKETGKNTNSLTLYLKEPGK